MTDVTPAAMPPGTLVGEFSGEDATAAAWADVEAILKASEMFWLSTVRSDGRPHVVPLPAMWDGGRLHFCTGGHEQKAKNLDADSRCALTTGTNRYRSGTDVVVEGVAERVVDQDRLAQLAALWKAKIDWQFDVGDGVFLDTTAGDHPAVVFAVTPTKILAFTKDPYSQTRFVPAPPPA
jgi:general stress protein 26